MSFKLVKTPETPNLWWMMEIKENEDGIRNIWYH